MPHFQRPSKLQIKATVIIVGIVASALISAEFIEKAYVAELAKETMQLKSISLLNQVNSRIQTHSQIRSNAAKRQYLQEFKDRNPDVLLLEWYDLPREEGDILKPVVHLGDDQEAFQNAASIVHDALITGKLIRLPQLSKDDHKMRVALPITVQEKVRGAIYAEFWTGQFDATTAFFHRWSYIIRMGVGILLIVAINGFLYIWVLRPLSTIRQGIASVTSGKWETVVPGESHDEFGQLTQNFNAMVTRIREVLKENSRLNEELIQARDELQSRVDHATTELLQRNQELETLNDRLLVAQREILQQQRLAVLGQLVATIAHKVGTPLTAISGHLQLLQEETRLSPEVQTRVQTLLRQTDRLSRAIQDLLRFTRTPSLIKESIPVHLLIEQTLNLFRPLCDQKEIDMVLDIDSSMPIIEGDPGQLQEVLSNLIDNAIDAMPSGGQLTVKTQAVKAESWEKDQEGLLIQVIDTGSGIPPEQEEKIFEPFFTTKRSGQGTGLGLAIAREIVNLHGGTLSLNSKEGKGVTFSIFLPAVSVVQP